MADYPPLSSLSIPDALDDIPDIAFVYRDDGLLMAMNGACERLTGVPRSAAVNVFNLRDIELTLGPTLVAAYRGAFAGQAQVVPATEVRIGV